MIKIKRVYDDPEEDDGFRYLVDRLWPRGMKKEVLKKDGWLKKLAPSTELRKWFGHDPDKWDEFYARYREELDSKPEEWQAIVEQARNNNVTLLYAAKDRGHNHAIVLRDFLIVKSE